MAPARRAGFAAPSIGLKTVRAPLIFALLSIAGACQPLVVAAAEPSALTGTVLVLAAASTTESMDQIRGEFARLHPAVKIRVSYAASSALAKQIGAGADADIFLSASSQWAEFANERKLIEKQRNFLGNELVIVVPKDSTLTIHGPQDLVQSGIHYLALADTKAVPAGVYARQALEKLNLWEQLVARATGAADVRQALAFVENGAAEAGIVYATDAAASDSVKVAARIDAKLTAPIRYPLVLLKHGAGNPAAVALYDYIGSPAAAAVFQKQGFTLLPSSADTPRHAPP